MTYTELTSKKNIENFLAIENAFRISVREKPFQINNSFWNEDTLGTEGLLSKALFLDRKFDNSTLSKWIPDEIKSNLVDANRNKSEERGIYDKIVQKYGNAFNQNKAEILKFIQKYLQSQISNLATRGPNKKILWTQSQDMEFINVTGADEIEIKKILKDSTYLKKSWFIPNKPSNAVFSVLIFWYFNNLTEAERKQIAVNENYKNSPIFILNLMLIIRLYSSIQHNFFPYEADEELMNQVMDDSSNRYNLVKFENIFEFLRYIAYSNVNNTVDIMRRPTDANYHYFLNNIIGRINSTIKSIASRYYKYVQEGKSVGVDKTLLENPEDGKTYMNISTNVSNDISEITRRLLINLSTNSQVDTALLEIVCKQTKTKAEKMKLSIEKMIENDSELVGSLLSDIITYYLVTLKQSKKTIRSMNFIRLLKRAYSISNTEDLLVLHIKEILDTLLEKNSTEYLKTSRVATRSTLRSTTYIYFVLFINKNSE